MRIVSPSFNITMHRFICTRPSYTSHVEDGQPTFDAGRASCRAMAGVRVLAALETLYQL